MGNGQKTQTTTWSCCGKTQETDENGVVTQYYYDEDKTTPVHDHRLWKVVQDYGTGKLNYTTQYTYDEVGNNTTVVNPRSKTTTYTYDAANRKRRWTIPTAPTKRGALRDDWRVYTHIDGRGRTVTFRYDADDRSADPTALAIRLLITPTTPTST